MQEWRSSTRIKNIQHENEDVRVKPKGKFGCKCCFALFPWRLAVPAKQQRVSPDSVGLSRSSGGGGGGGVHTQIQTETQKPHEDPTGWHRAQIRPGTAPPWHACTKPCLKREIIKINTT